MYQGPYSQDTLNQYNPQGVGSQIASALGASGASPQPQGGAAPAGKNWDQLVASGQYRRGSARAGGYVNNETNEWVPA